MQSLSVTGLAFIELYLYMMLVEGGFATKVHVQFFTGKNVSNNLLELDRNRCGMHGVPSMELLCL